MVVEVVLQMVEMAAVVEMGVAVGMAAVETVAAAAKEEEQAEWGLVDLVKEGAVAEVGSMVGRVVKAVVLVDVRVRHLVRSGGQVRHLVRLGG